MEFQKQADVIRIPGIITEGPEDIPRGTHHTITVGLNDTITIIKEKWLDFQIQKVKEASAEKQMKVLLLVFDREEGHFALATNYGYDYLAEVKGNVQKKDDEKKVESTFYKELVMHTMNYVQRYNIERVVVASPAFWKEYFMKEVNDPQLQKKIILATCSSADKTAFNEVLKRPEVETALKETRVVEELEVVEELLKEIMKNGLEKYGIDAVERAVQSGAVKQLLITDGYIKKTREENIFGRVDALLKAVDGMKGKITIISSENDGGKKLDGLGGIAVLLRYQFE